MKDIDSKGAHVNIAKAMKLAQEAARNGEQRPGAPGAAGLPAAAAMMQANAACAADIVSAVDRLTAAVVELKATLRSPGVAT